MFRKSHFFRLLPLIIFSFTVSRLYPQDKKPANPPASANGSSPVVIPSLLSKSGFRPFKEVATDKSLRFTGLFTVHKVDEKWYFEIPDSLFGREILAITRVAKTATGAGYGGEETNEQLLRFEKGPENKVFIRVVLYVNTASDTLPIFQAVRNSNLEPIAASFEIKTPAKDTSGTVIDVTDFFKGDNQIVSLSPTQKRQFNLGGPISDRSYINYIRTFPNNTEIRVTRTYGSSPSLGFSFGGSVGSIPAAGAAGSVTLELNTSMILLPATPYRKRFYDERVSYFSDSYTNYGLDAQKAQSEHFITRWRLEPRPEDIGKMKQGILVEPIKPIVYYIDPATPVKWRKYLKMGVEDWQKAFEKAGFRNAILAKDWPEGDTTMSLEDARFSVIRYYASEAENAYGPEVNDPRSGEIIESHIGWYHNVMNLLHNWYLIQAGAIDPGAQKPKFDDELMGQLIRFVSSHEIGHTLGLPHNMGASSATPVEKLRDRAWLEVNGHTASIMDYSRFNYVAQPEDSISPAGIFPRIGDYDKWSIEWGYKPIFDMDERQEKQTLNQWVEAHADDPRYRFMRQRTIPTDPRAQAEDLGDNAMKAGEYGIRNLKRILPNLSKWTFRPGENFETLDELFEQVLSQLKKYMGHAAANIGGIYEDTKTADQPGEVFTPVPASLQRDAIAFLDKNAFETPVWLLDWQQWKKFNQDQVVEEIRSFQQGILNSLLDAGRLERMTETVAEYGKKSYGPDDLLDDLRKEIWSELLTRKPIDVYRRNLQKAFVEGLGGLVNGSQGGNGSIAGSRRTGSAAGFTAVNSRVSDIISIAKGTLRTLRSQVAAIMPATTDRMTRYHFQDVLDRIDAILNPKGEK
ncbi:MAG: zinc-dependent metalloprotease [Puia sp.]|nr:zinc-dependent metalloprotease [Puia sp.]